jgi:hypothetical protein
MAFASNDICSELRSAPNSPSDLLSLLLRFYYRSLVRSLSDYLEFTLKPYSFYCKIGIDSSQVLARFVSHQPTTTTTTTTLISCLFLALLPLSLSPIFDVSLPYLKKKIIPGIDGSQVLAHFPSADNYNSSASVSDICKSVTNNKSQSVSTRSLLLFGHGDGGGGEILLCSL